MVQLGPQILTVGAVAAEQAAPMVTASSAAGFPFFTLTRTQVQVAAVARAVAEL